MRLRPSTEERIILAKLIGASVWEVQLYEHLDSHEGRERERLVQYQQAATDSDSPAFRYLASLIVEDEIRHHRVLRDLASALQTQAELRPDEPAIPRLEQWGADPQRIIELSEQLLTEERTDAEELHRLSRELRDLKDTTLWQLLVDLMEMDTAKHMKILEFVRRHAGQTAPS
jgi:rubrerythrin